MLEAAEAFAENVHDTYGMYKARNALSEPQDQHLPMPRAIQAVRWACSPSARNVLRSLKCVQQTLSGQAREDCAKAQAALVRCVFGSPFNGALDWWQGSAGGEAIRGPWLHSAANWQGGLIWKTAKAIYEARDFAALPILADMMEDADCPEPAVLAHLRAPGPHARGCWALDAVLGKRHGGA